MNDQYDTPEVRNGAVQYVECQHCGAKPGQTCRLTTSPTWNGRALRGFAHLFRRSEYHEWRDIYGPPTKSWEFSVLAAGATAGAHRQVETLPPCALPRPHCKDCSQCECGALLADHGGVRAKLAKEEAAPKKSNSDVDDLLG